MRDKVSLLHSVSVIATASAAVAVTGVAHAQSLPPITGYTYSVQGGLLFAPSPDGAAFNSAYNEKLSLQSGGYFDDVFATGFSSSQGFNAAGTFGVTFNNGWDSRVGLSVNRIFDNTATATGSYSSSSAGSGVNSGVTYTRGSSDSFTETQSFSFETGDFEVGFTPKLDTDLSVRLFGGIRALHFHASDTKTYSSAFSYSESSAGGGSGYTRASAGANNFESDFFGAGPRVGFSMAKRFDGSRFGFSGSLAGAAIFGQQTDTSSFTSSHHYTSSVNGNQVSADDGSHVVSTSSQTYSKTVLDLQAQAGVDYYLNDTSTLTFGYQLEELTNVGPGASSNTNQVVQGPFVKLAGSY